MISIIVAVSENDVIGSNQQIPWYLPADLKHFAVITKGNSVLMGRKTYESIISKLGQPLPDRENIVITRQPNLHAPEGVVVTTSLDEALAKATKPIFIIGGGELYRTTLPITNKIFLTRVHAMIEGDITFPELKATEWQRVAFEDHIADEKNQYDYTFEEYERKT